MTAIASISPVVPQHLVLEDVSWELYEHLLRELDNRPIRVTFDNGSIEIMPPLPEHELPKEAIGVLIDVLTLELEIPIVRYGSATFRRGDRLKGLEPDKCYYLRNAARVRGMKEFDSAIHPPPDLAIEIDITTRSVPREPVYAGLGVPELWRYNGQRLTVLLLGSAGAYSASKTSNVFPFLPMDRFEMFIHRMELEEQTNVLREFRQWVKAIGA